MFLAALFAAWLACVIVFAISCGAMSGAAENDFSAFPALIVSGAGAGAPVASFFMESGGNAGYNSDMFFFAPIPAVLVLIFLLFYAIGRAK